MKARIILLLCGGVILCVVAAILNQPETKSERQSYEYRTVIKIDLSLAETIPPRGGFGSGHLDKRTMTPEMIADAEIDFIRSGFFLTSFMESMKPSKSIGDISREDVEQVRKVLAVDFLEDTSQIQIMVRSLDSVAAEPLGAALRRFYVTQRQEDHDRHRELVISVLDSMIRDPDLDLPDQIDPETEERLLRELTQDLKEKRRRWKNSSSESLITLIETNAD